MRKYIDEKILIENLNKKADKNKIITTFTSPLLLEDNAEYYLSNISSLSLEFPEEKFECWLNIAFAENENIEIIFPENTNYIGEIPSFTPNSIWEISIKNKVVIAWRIK